MKDSYFSADRDRQVIEAGGFFCGACLVGKPIDDQSYDSRYCLGCYELLSAEALLSHGKRASWVPAVDHSKRGGALPVKREVVTKIPDKGNIPPQKTERIMLHRRGRPKKAGKVTRMTEWRREKAEQGVMAL